MEKKTKTVKGPQQIAAKAVIVDVGSSRTGKILTMTLLESNFYLSSSLNGIRECRILAVVLGRSHYNRITHHWLDAKKKLVVNVERARFFSSTMWRYLVAAVNTK